MFLKHLEVSGFKSFADTIKLDFEPGITSIVGPNGCGKSNIIDAIRWCLGEMSAKSLRSNLMMDVVFNGSGSRPPQNLSEVTLTFDNSDKRLPIDYSDVSITRRLFRSGESEYFINRTQCRLRDIKELFLDTGMGEDGYSSMEQGKVEWILQSKPEERRELFEEAAGVSKYRTRREEALRKLDRVEIDLSRLADIVSVTQEQIKKLENAVNKAQSYQRLKEQLKTAEISDWLFQLSNTESDLAQLRERLSATQRKSEELNTATHRIEAELSELRLSLTENDEELLKANGTLSSIDADIKIGEERLVNAGQREQELKVQLANVQQMMSREEKRIGELTQQEKSQLEDWERLKTEGSTIVADYKAAKANQDAAFERLENKQLQVKKVRDLILERAHERARLHQQMNRSASDLSRFEAEGANRQRELARAKNQLEEMERSLESVHLQKKELDGQMQSKAAELDALTRDLTTCESNQNALRNDLLAISEEIAQLKGQIHSLQEKNNEDPYLAGVQAALNAGLPGIHGPVGRLFQSNPLDRDLVAASLGEQLGDLVADTLEDAEKAIAFLAAENKGRARIWILDRLPQLPRHATIVDMPMGERLINRLQCEDKFKPLLTHLCSSLWLQGSTVYGDGLLHGGVDPAKWKSHSAHRAPELEGLLAQKESKKSEIEKFLDQKAAEKSQLSLSKNRSQKEMEEIRIRVGVGDEELNRLTSRKAVTIEEKNVIEMEIAQTFNEVAKAHDTLEEAKKINEQIQLQEQEDHVQLDLRQQELTELQLMHANSNGELSAKAERHNSFQEKLNWQKSILDHTQKELVEIRKSIEHHQSALRSVQTEIENAVKAQHDAKHLIETSLSKRQNAADTCQQHQNRRVEMSAKAESRQAELEKFRKELAGAQEELQNELINESTLLNKTETFGQKLMDQYEMTLETARSQFQPQAQEPDLIDRLKKRVTNIGPVNLAAPQEHAELVEKNTFLTQQQGDLLKAKDDLRQVITKINTTTREHFKETFYKVRENFRALYSKLFQGGEADLCFTNEADILSTGIDIFCQPPGKKLLHISLLSGGEKALTAIALLFAFFQVRPSPIALLDEVDAPLDEANVLRYVDMIKDFSDKSQFLIITHNKRTMEVANNLYGVTMEELGVSKVLSARLHKEHKEKEKDKEPALAAEPVAS